MDKLHTNQPANESTLDNLLLRGRFSLEDYNYKKAELFFEQALNLEPKSCEAYIGLAKAKARIVQDDEFFEYCVDQYNRCNTTLQRARQFADDEWTAFFDRVEIESQKREKERVTFIKKAKWAIVLIVIGIAIIIGSVYALPHIVFSPAQKLYKSGQYKQAYERAVEISSSGLGSLFDEGNVEKYAYAYLFDYIEQNGDMEIKISKNNTVKVCSITFSSGGTVFYFVNQVDIGEYSVSWVAEIYSDMDEASCSFTEFEYTSTGKESSYIEHGDFTKSAYRNGGSIESSLTRGIARRNDEYSLSDNGTVTISEALSLIQETLGIPAEHLGFYAYKS